MKYDQAANREKSRPANGMARYKVTPAEPNVLSFGYPQSTNPDDQIPIAVFGRSDVAAAVAEFHAAFNLPHQSQPTIDVEGALEALRISLLEEEVSELIAATNARDLVGIADALADITYVVYGTALTYGIDLDGVLSEVHRSNMSKLDSNGKPIIRADGKVLKSERYSPPNVAAVLQHQALHVETAI